jgi:hypothetical protein
MTDSDDDVQVVVDDPSNNNTVDVESTPKGVDGGDVNDENTTNTNTTIDRGIFRRSNSSSKRPGGSDSIRKSTLEISTPSESVRIVHVGSLRKFLEANIQKQKDYKDLTLHVIFVIIVLTVTFMQREVQHAYMTLGWFF